MLVYEFERKALASIIGEDISAIDRFVQSLAEPTWRESRDSVPGIDPKPVVVARPTELHRGRIQSAYILESNAPRIDARDD